MRRILVLTSLLFACSTDSFTGDDGGGDAPFDNVISGGDGSIGDATGKDVVVTKPRYCETIDAQFCADFDVPNDAGAGFAQPVTLGGWSFTFQNAQAASKPTAVRVDTNTDAGAAFVENPNISLGKGGGINTLLTVEADVYLPSAINTPDPLFVFRAGVVPAPVQLTYGLAALANAWRLVHPLGGSPALVTPQPPTGEWLHAVLTIAVTAGNVTLVLTDSSSNDYTASMSSVPTSLDGGTSNYPGFIHVGADDIYPGAAPITFDVDNVVAHWQ